MSLSELNETDLWSHSMQMCGPKGLSIRLWASISIQPSI